jgi:catechol 2,3-dioxygenase-like lactoylglutathione lyase family enzyme
MIKGLNHVGISVSNLERAVEFYRNAFGMQIVVQSSFEGERDEAILGLRGARGRVATVALGHAEIELFEFASPTPKSADPNRPVCDHGISHFCLQVSDLHAEYARLKAAGVAFHCPPQEFPGVGRATYGRDPDGNVFELIELFAGG